MDIRINLDVCKNFTATDYLQARSLALFLAFVTALTAWVGLG